jgi:hypothetical protein
MEKSFPNGHSPTTGRKGPTLKEFLVRELLLFRGMIQEALYYFEIFLLSDCPNLTKYLI